MVAVAAVAILLKGVILLSGLYLQEQSEVQTLSSQVTKLQTQLSNLRSENSNLQSQNSNLSTSLSQYEKTFSALNVAWTCTFGSELILTLTNFGSQNVTVPASGVTVVGPNGSTYLPTPAVQLTFSVFNHNLCISPPTSILLQSKQTSVTVPPEGEAWLQINELSLLWIAPPGNYVITFLGVTTANGGRVSVDPLPISWTGPPTLSISYTRFTVSGPTGEIFIQDGSLFAAQPYQATLSYGGASCSENYSPPPSIAPGSGLGLAWSYQGGNPCPNTQAMSGQQYSGSVIFFTGFELLYTGTFRP